MLKPQPDALRPEDFGISPLLWDLPEALIVADLDSRRAVLWNAAAEALSGYTAEEARALPIESMLAERARAPFLAAIDSVAESGGPPWDRGRLLRLPALDGSGAEQTVEVTFAGTAGPRPGGRYVIALLRRGPSDVHDLPAVREVSERVHGLLADAHVALFLFDQEGRITLWRGCGPFEPVSAPGEALGRSIFEVGQGEPGLEEAFRATLRGREADLTVSRGDRVYQLRCRPRLDSRGEPAGGAVVSSDISDSALARSALEASQAQLQDFLDSASDLIQSVAEDGRFLYVNHAWEQALGYRMEDLAGMTAFDLIHPEDRAHCAAVFGRLLAGERMPAVETRFLTHSGRTIWVEGSVRCSNHGSTRTTQGIFRDVSDRRAREAALARQGLEDALTGLPNRRMLGARLEELLASARSRHDGIALLYIDLDGFKAVNDIHGHATGDALLVAVAGRIEGFLRGSDLVARVGGDEFVALLAPAGALDQIRQVANRLVTAISVPYAIGGLRLAIGASVGVALVTTDSVTPEALLHAADRALYEAKAAGKGQVAVAR